MFRNILQFLPNTINYLLLLFSCGKTWSVTDTPKKNKSLGPCAFLSPGVLHPIMGSKLESSNPKKHLNFLDFLLLFLLQGHLNHQAGVLFFSGKTSYRFRSLQICPCYHSHPFSSWCITMWKSRLESLLSLSLCRAWLLAVSQKRPL